MLNPTVGNELRSLEMQITVDPSQNRVIAYNINVNETAKIDSNESKKESDKKIRPRYTISALFGSIKRTSERHCG